MRSLYSKTARTDILAPLGLFVISLVLRLSVIGKGFYHPDALFLGIQSEKILASGHIHYLHLIGYPLTALLGAFFLWIGQALRITDPAVSINALSAIFSSLTIVIFYDLLKKILSPLAALLSASLLLVHPFFFAASVFGNSHMPSLFFFVLSLDLILIHRRDNRAAFFWLAAVSAGFMAAARPQNIIQLFPVGYAFLSWDKDSQPPGLKHLCAGLKKYGAFILVTGCVCFMFYIPMLRTHGGLVIDGGSPRDLWLSILPDLTAWGWWVSLKKIVLSFSPLGLIFIIIGLGAIFQKSRRLFTLIVCWALPAWIVFGCLATYVPRYSLNTVIALTIPIGHALSRLIHKNFRGAALGLLSFILLATLLWSDIYSIVLFRHRHDLMGDFGSWIKAKTPSDAVIYAQDEQMIIEHYADRAVKKAPFIKYAKRIYTAQDRQNLSAALQEIRDLLRDKVPVYITSSALTAYDPQKRFARALRAGFRLNPIGDIAMEEWHQGITTLILYRERLYQITSR